MSVARISKDEAGYREAYQSEECCKNCNKFNKRRDHCSMVAGFIEETRVCEFWIRKFHAPSLRRVRLIVGME